MTRSNAVTTTVGVVHRFSPATHRVAFVPAGSGATPPPRKTFPGQAVPIVRGETRDDNGTFFGGSLGYEFRRARSSTPASQGACAERYGDDQQVTYACAGHSRTSSRNG